MGNERINTSTINKTEASFVDRDVRPGIPHYYYFTVVSDGGESQPSNLAMGRPEDTILPVLNHSPETVALFEENLTIRANASDNVGVVSVTLYFRSAGGINWVERDMVLTDDDRYSATIEGAQITGDSLEYYIEVKDTQNSVYFASADSPQTVTVSYPSGIDSDGDGVSNAEDAFL